jgi:hypothetical protein
MGGLKAGRVHLPEIRLHGRQILRLARCANSAEWWVCFLLRLKRSLFSIKSMMVKAHIGMPCNIQRNLNVLRGLDSPRVP